MQNLKFSADANPIRKMTWQVKCLVITVIIIAALVLLGWQFDIEFFKHPLPGSQSMNPASAVAFIFASVSILFLAAARRPKWKLTTGYFFAALVLLIGLLKFLSSVSVLNFHVDSLLFPGKVKEGGIVPIAAVNFILTGIALVLLNFETRRKGMASHYIVLITFLFGLLSLIGYLYNVKTFYGLLVYLPMAIHAGVCFLFLSLAILFVYPGKGIMKEFTSPFSGSFIARLLIPAAIILPVLLGLLRLWLQWMEVFPIELGTALLMLMIVVVFLIMTWFIVVSLNKRDKLKQQIENALRESERQIQTIFNAAPDAVIVTNEEGRIVRWNPKAESLLGWQEKEVLGKLLSETVIPERFREVHKKELKHFLRTGEAPLIGKIVETCALRKNGTELDIALNIAATPETDNKHLFIGFLRDITEQKKSEQKFKGLLEAAPDAMIIANKEGKIVLINQQTETVFGYRRHELIGKQVEILIPAGFHSKHAAHRNKYFTEPKVRSMGVGLELFAARRDGTQFPVEISLSPLQTEEGLLVSASVRDITDRKKAEEKLRESQQMFSSLFHKSPVMNAISEITNGKFVEVNDSFADFMNYKREDLIGKTSGELKTLVHPEQRPLVMAELQANGFVRGLEVQVLAKNGKKKWISTNIDKINLKGKDCLLTAAIDISERKEAEQLIRKQRQDIQDLIDSMSTLCAKVNTHGKIIIVNKTALLASGLSMDELLNTNFLEGQWWAFDARVHSRVRQAFEKACSGVAVTYDENIFAFNQVLTINFSLTPIFTSTGEVDYIVAEGRDITALKLTEAALTEKTNQLVALNEELEAFTYSVSHDLRAPLRGIIGFTNILEEDYASKLDDEAKRITTVIKNNTLKMGHLIDDLLAFSRIGRQDILKAKIDTAVMVYEVIEELTPNRKKIEWIIHPLPGIKGDINTIRQVWINLISNAIKYSGNKEKPRIEIGFFDQGSQSVFYVKDNGVGFDEQYKDKLFKVFQRLHSAEEFEGTGVGLALVEKIISKHGGKVWAKGKENEGACFYFSLPA